MGNHKKAYTNHTTAHHTHTYTHTYTYTHTHIHIHMGFCSFLRFFEKSFLPFWVHFTHIGTHFDVTCFLFSSVRTFLASEFHIHDPFLAVSWPFSFLKKSCLCGPCISPVSALYMMSRSPPKGPDLKSANARFCCCCCLLLLAASDLLSRSLPSVGNHTNILQDHTQMIQKSCNIWCIC